MRIERALHEEQHDRHWDAKQKGIGISLRDELQNRNFELAAQMTGQKKYRGTE